MRERLWFLSNIAEKGFKADASCLAHLFQNCVWLPTKLVFKIALLLKKFLSFLVEKVYLFYKTSWFQKEKCFKTLSIFFPFHK